MTVFQIAERLRNAGIDPDSAREEARLLVMHFTGTSLSRLLAEPNADYASPALEAAVEKRAGRYPLQYLFGEWEFMGLPFTVNESCLIPRPDTEVIAEAAVSALKPGERLLDLCTGSGCIAAAVLYHTKNTTAKAVELCPDTAEIARRNLNRLGLSDRCEVLTGDATTDLFPTETKFSVITANPPYVTKEEMQSLEAELSFEPRIALTDEGDGLSILKAIIGIYRNHLTPTGTMILEYGWKQAEAVKTCAESFGLHYAPLQDYGGNTRGAKLTRE